MRWFLCLAVVVLIATAGMPGCATDNKLSGTAADSSGTSPTQPGQLLGQIPFPADTPMDRRAAVPTPNYVNGNDEFRHGPGSYDSELHHVLEPYPGELHWAIYRLPANGYQALSVQVRLVVLEGEYYFGIANYAKGAWEFGPALTAEEYSRPVTLSHVSPQDRLFIVIVAHDAPNSIRVANAAVVLDQPGWAVTTVDGAGLSVPGLRLFADGPMGYPRLAMLVEGAAELYSADTLQPAGQSSWELIIADAADEDTVMRSPLQARFVDGRPALAYVQHGADYQLKYTYGTDEQPASGEWVTVDIDSPCSNSFTGCMGFVEVGALPRIVYQRYDGTNACWLASSSTASPASADWAVSKVSDSAVRPSLAVVNGRLACSYIGTGGTWLRYARALVDQPTGPANWDVSDVYGPDLMGYAGWTGIIATPLDTLEGPVIACTFAKESPRVRAATLAQPTVPGDWDLSALDTPEWVGDFKLELQLIGERPALAYYLENELLLRLAWATTANPADETDWQIATISSGVEIGAMTLAEVGGQPALAYIDKDTGEIRYTYYDAE